MSVAGIAHQSFLAHGIGDADDRRMGETQPLGEIGDAERPMGEKELIGRGPPGAKREAARLVELVRRAEERLRQAAKSVIEDQRAELSNVVHGVELRKQLRK